MDPIVAQRQDVRESGDVTGDDGSAAGENPLSGIEYACQAPRGPFQLSCRGTMRYDADRFAFVCETCGHEEPLL